MQGRAARREFPHPLANALSPHAYDDVDRGTAESPHDDEEVDMDSVMI